MEIQDHISYNSNEWLHSFRISLQKYTQEKASLKRVIVFELPEKIWVFFSQGVEKMRGLIFTTGNKINGMSDYLLPTPKNKEDINTVVLGLGLFVSICDFPSINILIVFFIVFPKYVSKMNKNHFITFLL